MSFKLRATNLQNVAAGNVATLKLPTGANAPTLDKVILELTGTTFTDAHVLSIKGKANGRLFYDEGAGTIMNKRAAYSGEFNAAGFLMIDFTEAKARNGALEQLMASVPMSMLQSLTFEIEVAGTAVAPKIDAQIVVRQPTNNPYILKLLNTSQSFSASGEQILFLPTGGAGGKVKRIWIHETTAGTITDAQIRVGNSVAYETNRAKLEYCQKTNGLTPQAGIVVLDFIEDGNLSGVLDTGSASGVELRLTSSAANTYKVYYEFIDQIGRL
ncbi:hypothetical protein HUU62_04340 [Rhodoferax sp. 4810]|nr:hypothetical protein [Rhodoferax jenense]